MSQQVTGPDDFSPQDWQELYELKEQVDQTAEQTGIPRRDILKGAGLLAAGSLAGGISAQQAIERFVMEAEAQASTSDSDGNVGTPTDRVDVFSDGIDSNSVSTEDVNITNIAGRGVLDSTQTVSPSTVTKLNLGSVDIEDSTILTVDTTNNQITIEKAGKYLVNSLVRIDGSANWSSGDRMQHYIKTNGNSSSLQYDIHNGANEIMSQSATFMGEFSADDAITFSLFHTSGGDETVLPGDAATYLEVMRLG